MSVNIHNATSALDALEAPSSVAGQPQRKFKLLAISSDTYPPTRVDVAILFGEELAGRGHRIDWLLQSEAPCDQSYVTSWAGGRVWVGATNHGFSLLGRIRKHFAGIWNDLKVFTLLEGEAYDAVEVKDKFISGVFALVAARWYHKRFLYWLSFPFPEAYLTKARDGLAPYPLLYRLRGLASELLLYRLLLPAADHIFVQSEQMRRDVAAKGIPLSKMTAVPMGIKLDGAMTARSPLSRSRIPAGEPCFVYLGALGRERRVDFLLRVLVEVRREVPTARLYLVGKADSPEEQEFLLQEARRLDLSTAVAFTGQLPRQEALLYVQDADVCVSPLYPTPVLNAASPTKLVEYMAMGKAVVANTHPDQQLLIEASGCGYCVQYQETEFAKAIVTLLRSPDDARAMGERGRKYVIEHRSYEVIAGSVERELLRITGRGGEDART
jgi:glycosyltransferase involved in cell wall biosynthesis